MLSPALQQFSRERIAFENDLHSDLLHIAHILGTARQFKTHEKRGERAQPPSLDNCPHSKPDCPTSGRSDARFHG
jgi:hypothetical protein